MTLPYFKSEDQSLTLLQTNWANQINPLLQNAANQSILLKSISLLAGSNTINHLLQRKLQGWKIIRQRAPASIYDLQDANQTPNLTLVLFTSAPVIVDLEVF